MKIKKEDGIRGMISYAKNLYNGGSSIKLPKISTKKEIHRAFEEIISKHGPQTCKGLVETVKNEYQVRRVQIDSDRASQYLRQNPNITILGDVYLNGNVHLYGLKDVEYNLESFELVVASHA